MDYNMLGPIFALGLSAFGSVLGCYIAGSASHAAMSRTEEGHGKFVMLSAAPSSIIIFGFLLMLLMNRAIVAGTLSPFAGLMIGLISGSVIMSAGIFMGKVCATGMQATLQQPSAFGKCFAAIGLIESTALFVFVFSLLLM